MDTTYHPYLLVLFGLLLIFLEFFVPGGILGLAGALFLCISLISFAVTSDSLLATLLYTFIVLALLGFLIRFALWRIRKTSGDKTIYSDDDQQGFVASSFNEEAIGKEGIALTDLKPSGKIRVNGQDLQATSEMGYVTKGTHIVVVRGEGAHVIVKGVDHAK